MDMTHVRDLTLRYIDTFTNSSTGNIQRLPVCDDGHGTYAILTIGWQATKRIVGVTLLVTMDDSSVTIHHDGTPGFADYLLDHGVPESMLQMALYPPRAVVV